jgi:hypothetical protein
MSLAIAGAMRQGIEKKVLMFSLKMFFRLGAEN